MTTITSLSSSSSDIQTCIRENWWQFPPQELACGRPLCHWVGGLHHHHHCHHPFHQQSWSACHRKESYQVHLLIQKIPKSTFYVDMLVWCQVKVATARKTSLGKFSDNLGFFTSGVFPYLIQNVMPWIKSMWFSDDFFKGDVGWTRARAFPWDSDPVQHRLQAGSNLKPNKIRPEQAQPNLT